MLVHEIKPIGVLDDYEKNIKTLYDFGYGVAATRVFNYWDPEVPVTVSRPDAVALVVTKPGSALVLACDYGAGGEATLALDLARLGMRGPLRATDTESNAPLDVSADSRVQCPLKKHDFRLIRIEGQVP
jgi:hypothetical protein